MKSKGFTLIELLVVIAIIGILATIVLASLNSARAKANDTAVKADLNNARAAAELYYDNAGQTYLSVCGAGTTVNPGILTMQNAAKSVGGGTTNCFDDATHWAMSANLKSNTAQYWCVDNTGTSTLKTAAVSTFACPAN